MDQRPKTSMKGFWVYLSVYLTGLTLDLLSTLFCMHKFSDWTLAQEFNPLIKNSSFLHLALYAGSFGLVMLSIFYIGWTRRTRLYSEPGLGFGAFCRRAISPQRLENVLLLLCLLAPMIVAFGHYRVTVTNSLQALGKMHWGPLWIFVLVRMSEVLIYAAMSLWVVYMDYRHHNRRRSARKIPLEDSTI